MRSVLARRRVFGRHSAGAYGLPNARSPIPANVHNAHHARDAGLGLRSRDVPAGAASPCNADCHTGVTTTAASATDTAPAAGTQTTAQTQSVIFTYAPAGGGQGSFTRASDSSTSTEATEYTSESAGVDSGTYFTTSAATDEIVYTDVEASTTFSVAPTSFPTADSDPEPTTRSTKSSSGQSERTAYTLSSSHTSTALSLSEPSSLTSSSAAAAQTSSAATSQPTTSNTAALAGGIIGGLVGLGLLILLVMFIKRRQQRPRSLEIGKLAPSQAFMRENSDARSRYVANGASFARIDSRDEQGDGTVRAPTPAWMHPRAKTPESTKTFLNLD
ncbi:uncharacterized protein SCHCODRAFT_02710062 [Schizophyllum commune H4-8]|uniref:uncharacterized protein n=1 Tax=Schizophyllum commune (strain H4-8 / FGSC 9210) TaxID=578458 RepID=UPI00215FFD5D|nr:uncharacterized protein SCHCODRAFT_02710062 [Schizophyllum commune H4-8]KAI5900207.1 hypothetical protein SCHCODRAFT_02710062 [Schizophyllum commune H4-8]